MTIVQLEYIIALDTYRHFAAAARHCYITQPTLSMQIAKLEQELGIMIFDRSKQPVLPTEAGAELLIQARRILAECELFESLVQSRKGVLAGELRLGIIPTLAPYILPLFVKSFTLKYPGIRLQVQEMTTAQILLRLKEGRIDAGILVTPLHDSGISEIRLFHEELMVYVSRKNALFKKNYILSKDIDPGKLWILEEGHCFRSQIVNLCELRKAGRGINRFEYEAGSIETLRRMVDINEGITILPELATMELGALQRQQVKRFRSPVPMREVSLVMHRDFVKKKLISLLQEEIVASIPEKIKKNRGLNTIPVD